MPYRTFVDSSGSDWQVWDIIPRMSERRQMPGTDRRVEIRPIGFADRRVEPRRLAETRRAILRGNYALGWLCFDSHMEKRRLSPIPGDWTVCSKATLENYLRAAEPVKGNFRSLNTQSGDDYAADAG